jgi:hypothetical protein
MLPRILSKMTFAVNVVAQVALLAVQAANKFGDVVPAKYQPAVFAVAGIAQGTLALIAHFRNPNGTPASAPYTPKQ